ncbi:hypothetical protein [Streptomyces sp. NBRC 110611]|uniref:hypothetical protein n=1 Tax=Streptomyces sp. NBRC 110611 TaxID=1621259 RepID=UPI00082D985D|nr:hypothetical protein [Streptomyces sp. NBRC 110611]
MARHSKAQETGEQAEPKMREARKKAAQRSGRTSDADKAWQEKLRRQQEEQDRRDTFDENYEV